MQLGRWCQLGACRPLHVKLRTGEKGMQSVLERSGRSVVGLPLSTSLLTLLCLDHSLYQSVPTSV